MPASFTTTSRLLSRSAISSPPGNLAELAIGVADAVWLGASGVSTGWTLAGAVNEPVAAGGADGTMDVTVRDGDGETTGPVQPTAVTSTTSNLVAADARRTAQGSHGYLSVD